MEKNIPKLMALKQIRGFGNRKIINLGLGLDFDDEYSKLAEKHNLEYEYKKSLEIIDYCGKNNIRIVSYLDSEYPIKLKNIPNPPLLLFAAGNLELLNKASISIVGTRQAALKSLEWAYEAAKKLASEGYVIISGGARGIDSYAHKAALDAGETICVLGSGINNIYPMENEKLIKGIMQKGLVISEQPPNANVTRLNLLERNRITSGLGDLLLLVATKSAGGAMSQFKVAYSQKKKVFCPSPSLGLEPNEGIIGLIKEGRITPVRNVEEILNMKNMFNQQSILLNAY